MYLLRHGRAKYDHSRILIEYDDGTSFGACSLHCAAVDLANNIDKAPRMIGVEKIYGLKVVPPLPVVDMVVKQATFATTR